MQEAISDLQIYESRDFSGLTTENHLASAYLSEPEQMEGVLAYAFGIKNNNVLSLLTGGIGNTRLVDNRQYKWDVHGQTERAVRVSKATPETQPGLSGGYFRIYLEEHMFESTDNLRADSGAMVRVVSEPFQDGAHWVYTVQLTSPDSSKYLESSDISVGSQFSKLYSTVEEYSIKGGGTNYNTPVKLINQLTTLRKHYDVSRTASKTVMRIELPDPDDPSKKATLWTKVAEWTAMAQWYKEVDRSMIYTEFNSSPITTYTNMKGESGRPVYHGAGFRQQISPSNIKYYSHLTYGILDDFLLNLSYAADAWGGDHKFVALTGKMGFREFDRAVRQEMKDAGITVTDSGTFVSGTGQNLTFQGQFTTVKFLNGIELTVKEFPPYDDRVHNRTKHPVSGKPLESYRFTILNFGTKNGKNNIRKVALRDSENAIWHVCGSTDPFGGVAKSMSTMRSSSIDGYRVELLAECGIQVEDPTSCGELIMELD